MEFVFVDDGFIDLIKEFLMKFLKEVNKEIKIILLERNKGILYVRFEGMKNSEGKYIFFYDIDDLIYYNGIVNIVNDLESVFDKYYLVMFCVFMKEGEFIGEIGYYKILFDVLDYVVEGIKNLFGLVFFINIFILKDLIINVFWNVINIFDKGNVNNMSVVEDILIVDYMIFFDFVYKISFIYYIF